MEFDVWICIENAGKNYSAYAPEVPGCVSTGGTIDDARASMIAALTSHIEWMLKDGDSVDGIKGDFAFDEFDPGEYYCRAHIKARKPARPRMRRRTLAAAHEA
jgi:predicted RNase H-like HicB family nuclease